MVVVVMVGVVRRHLLDTGGDASHRLDAPLRGRPAPCPPLSALPSPRGSRAPPCLFPGAYVALPPAVGPAHCHLRPSLHRGARILPASLPMSLAVPPFADRTPFCPMCSVAARFGALLASLRQPPGAAEAVGWGPAALALEDPENATEHKNQASTMTPVSGVIFSIPIALGVHLTTFYTNLSRIFAAWQD